ncbi:hypothetical protein [Pseudarthrobacter sp. SSS035]|uniref:hypothetical protein n=1 Tax=Pseudarthrobacter sp. SSS035 TaxID=2931399 RepID=UPI00200DF761|nr:hypothetical protein [Pseudarthrobacter sp. SSS035]
MSHEEQAAPPVLKTRILPPQPGPVGSLSCVSSLYVLALMMPERIFDHKDRDLPMTVTALSSDEPVPKILRRRRRLRRG